MLTIPSDEGAKRSRTAETLESDEAELAARLRMAISRLARALRKQSATGLTLSQQGILATLHDVGSITPGELARREQVSAPSISRAIGLLESDDLIRRHPSEADGRSIQVSITPTGRERLQAARSRRNAWLALRLAELEPIQRERLVDSIEVLESLTAPAGSAPAGLEDRGEP